MSFQPTSIYNKQCQCPCQWSQAKVKTLLTTVAYSHQLGHGGSWDLQKFKVFGVRWVGWSGLERGSRFRYEPPVCYLINFLYCLENAFVSRRLCCIYIWLLHGGFAPDPTWALHLDPAGGASVDRTPGLHLYLQTLLRHWLTMCTSSTSGVAGGMLICNWFQNNLFV